MKWHWSGVKKAALGASKAWYVVFCIWCIDTYYSVCFMAQTSTRIRSRPMDVDQLLGVVYVLWLFEQVLLMKWYEYVENDNLFVDISCIGCQNGLKCEYVCVPWIYRLITLEKVLFTSPPFFIIYNWTSFHSLKFNSFFFCTRHFVNWNITCVAVLKRSMYRHYVLGVFVQWFWGYVLMRRCNR